MSRLDGYKPNLKRAAKKFQEGMGTLMAAPVVAMHNRRRAQADADTAAIKTGRQYPKYLPKLDESGRPSESFMAHSMAETAKERVLKRAKKLKK